MKDIQPPGEKFLSIGTRVCAHWSPQYRCFYPGTVTEGELNFTRGGLIQYFTTDISTHSCHRLIFVLCPGKFILNPLLEMCRSGYYEAQFLFYGSVISIVT